MGSILVEYADNYNYNRVVTPYAANVTRTWVRNEIGTASITFPLTTPGLYGIIQWGRIFRIYEYGTPTWVGVVTERDWSAEGVELSLKSAEWLLQKSLTGQGLAFPAGTTDGKTAYGLFMSGYGNNYAKPIRPGIFDASRPRFVEPYNYADCWAELKKLADDDGAEVWVDENLYVHFRNRRGIDKSTSIKLREGKHLVGVKVRDSIEDTLTKGVALGKGDNITARPKTGTAYNGELGYERAEVLTFDNVESPDGLRDPLLQAISSRVFPRLTVDAYFVKVITDAAPNGEFWNEFFVGDTIDLMITSYLNSAGLFQLEGKARVLGIELGGEDQMRLVLEVEQHSGAGLPFLPWMPGNAAV